MEAVIYRREEPRKEVTLMKDRDAAPDEANTIMLHRAHAIWIGVMSVLGPFATAVWFVASIKSDVKTDINNVRLEAAQLYVKKDDLKPVADAVYKMNESVAEIKGYLSAKQDGKK